MSDSHPLASTLPEILVVSWGGHKFKTPDGLKDPYEPFLVDRSWYNQQCATMAPRRWPKLLPLAQYNKMIESFERDELIAHVKVRREQTDEDLSAQAATPEMREALKFDIEAVAERLTGDDDGAGAAAE